MLNRICHHLNRMKKLPPDLSETGRALAGVAEDSRGAPGNSQSLHTIL
jgi:hypothetical protein